MLFITVLVLSIVLSTNAQKNLNYVDGRTTMVHLFEWKYKDIALECERFLGPKGYAGVQVSPINENLILEKRPWFERYQPMSYKIKTRSGDEAAFREMVQRCNNVGVRIYVDAVINHMTADRSPAVGTDKSTAETENCYYPGVPYGREDFHPSCAINNYKDPDNVRNCELAGLHDLDQSKPHVRRAIIEFMDRAVDFGIAGFRIDAAKHMWPEDLKYIYSHVKNLSTEAGFAPGTRPYFYQEVIDLGGEGVSKYEYTSFGAVIEFQFGIVLGNMFRGQDQLKRLWNWGNGLAWRLVDSDDALVMIDNHDNQRGHGAGGEAILTYKNPKEYIAAIAFMLATPYGHPRVMSSFAFNDSSAGPPADSDENILSPEITNNGLCGNGWVCEHRWPAIFNMVKFSNIVNKEPVYYWWTNGNNQMSFSRGAKGFVAFNVENSDLRQVLKTGLPSGKYCDIISGDLINGRCTGKTIQVNENSSALIEIPVNDKMAVIATHIQAKL